MKYIKLAIFAFTLAAANIAFVDETCPPGDTVQRYLNNHQTQINYWNVTKYDGSTIKRLVFVRASGQSSLGSNQVTIPACQYLGLNDKDKTVVYMLIPKVIHKAALTGQDWDRYGAQCGYPGPKQDIPAQDYPLTSCSFKLIN